MLITNLSYLWLTGQLVCPCREMVVTYVFLLVSEACRMVLTFCVVYKLIMVYYKVFKQTGAKISVSSFAGRIRTTDQECTVQISLHGVSGNLFPAVR